MPKKHLIFFLKRWLFLVNKHPFFYQNTDIGWTGTRIITLDFIIRCLYSGSRLGSPVTSGVTQRQSRVYFVDCKGIFAPHTSYLGTKKYPSFTESRTCGGLREIHNAGVAHLCTWVPSPGIVLNIIQVSMLTDENVRGFLLISSYCKEITVKKLKWSNFSQCIRQLVISW